MQSKHDALTFSELAARNCTPLKGPHHRIDAAAMTKLLEHLPAWGATAGGGGICRDFKFSDFYRTIAFVNAIAWFANQEDHHPDLEVGYGHCRVTWSTHDVDGLSINDFICAAKTQLLTAA